MIACLPCELALAAQIERDVLVVEGRETVEIAAIERFDIIVDPAFLGDLRHAFLRRAQILKSFSAFVWKNFFFVRERHVHLVENLDLFRRTLIGIVHRVEHAVLAEHLLA